MPPHAQMFDFLPDAERLALFEWAVSMESSFKPADVFYGKAGQQAKLDPAIRQARKLPNVGPFEHVLRERLFEELTPIMAGAGFRGDRPISIDFELNAYGDGAHFKPHIDIALGTGRKRLGLAGNDRVITAVYYFYQEPRRFSGGDLRLYRFGADSSDLGKRDEVSKSFEPIQNSLLIFPSWARHSVELVSCPSDRFNDSRFAINCWFCS